LSCFFIFSKHIPVFFEVSANSFKSLSNKKTKTNENFGPRLGYAATELQYMKMIKLNIYRSFGDVLYNCDILYCILIFIIFISFFYKKWAF